MKESFIPLSMSAGDYLCGCATQVRFPCSSKHVTQVCLVISQILAPCLGHRPATSLASGFVMSFDVSRLVGTLLGFHLVAF